MKSQNYGGAGTPKQTSSLTQENIKKRGRSPLTPRKQQIMNEASKFIEMQQHFGKLMKTSRHNDKLSPISRKGGKNQKNQKTRRKKSSIKHSDV